ncbi:MAG: succinylglutamate desuccinylase/aspartoacylase family protein [Chloroflexota bacterium]
MHFRDFSIPALLRNQKETNWLTVAPRVDGGEWRLPLLTITGREAGPTLVVTAAVHGNEYEGIEAIPQVFAQLQPEALRGTLVMMPVCNMPAYEAATRNSPIDGLNLARVFPGDEHGTITQQIAYWITERLIKAADFFIDLHSGSPEADVPTLIGYLHSDDELGQRALAGAKAFGAPVLWGHPHPIPPGRTVSAATANNVPWLYTETPGGGRATVDDVECYVVGVRNVMRHLGMLEGDPQPRLMTHHLFGDGNLDQIINAPVAGLFRPSAALLDQVKAGQTLGIIQDFFGNPLAAVTAQQAGVVILLRRVPRVNVGDGVVQVTGQLIFTSDCVS